MEDGKLTVDAQSTVQDNLSTCETLPTHASTPKAEPVPKDFLVIPVPKYLRHSAEKPAQFSLFLNCLFAVATTFSACTVAAMLHSSCLPTSDSCCKYLLVPADSQCVP